MIPLSALVLLAFGFSDGKPGVSAEVENALAHLAKPEFSGTPEAARPHVQVIRQEMSTGDFDLWSRLRKIVEQGDVAATLVFDVALEKADPRIALDMLALVDQWYAEASRPTTRIQLRMAGRFVERLADPTWAPLVADDPRVLKLLERAALATCCPVDMTMEANALRALNISGAPVEQRRAIAERMIANKPSVTWLSDDLLRLLGRSSLPRLRELVRESLKTPRQIHLGAAAALAQLGDAEILPDLEAVRPELRAIHKNLEALVVEDIKKIELQNPPASLIDYIASADWPCKPRREWAVERAVACALPKEQIREAILRHVRDAQPIKRTLRDGRTVTQQPYHAQLKKTGLDLGILRPDDLPDVKIYEYRITP